MEINERLDKIEATLEILGAGLAAINAQLKPPATTVQSPAPVAPPPPAPVAPPPPAPVAPPPPAPVAPPPAPPPPAPVAPPPAPPPPVQHPIFKDQRMDHTVTPVASPVLVPTTAHESTAQLINLLNSKEWPHAVDPTLICDITSEQDKEDRAEGILDLIIDVHLENLKFLDFGCGEGHVVNRSKTQKPKMAVGYDIKKSDKWDKWDKVPNVVFTNTWDDVKSFGPFNVILMYDVIDHMMENEQEVIENMKQIKKALAINGKVYLRAHPWCSRHGTHLYHQINKAFVHMVFTNEELNSMGYKQEEVRKVMTPLTIYSRIFQSAGFKIQNGPYQIKEGVENFFINNPLISNRIKSHYKNCEREDLRSGKFPSGPMENQFIDYILI